MNTMKFLQFNSRNSEKPVNHSVKENVSDSGCENMSEFISNTGKLQEKFQAVEIQEMEQRNVQLENLVSQLTNELIDKVATNSKFITIIAHDLRSPFVSILGALELLRNKLEQDNIKDVDEYVNIAAYSARRTLNLLDNLLAWAVSQNSEKSFTPVKINLKKVLAFEISNINYSARQKQIKLNNSIASELNVSGDLQMIKTVFRNLISNAVKYTNPGGEISITARAEGAYVEISVKDNGIGISQEVQNDLFKAHTYKSTPGTKNEKGTGLGLLLCKEFVELNGGKIQVESKKGTGSEFKITLPHYI